MRLGLALQFESEECDLPMCGYTLQVADYVSLVSPLKKHACGELQLPMFIATK